MTTLLQFQGTAIRADEVRTIEPDFDNETIMITFRNHNHDDLEFDYSEEPGKMREDLINAIKEWKSA